MLLDLQKKSIFRISYWFCIAARMLYSVFSLANVLKTLLLSLQNEEIFLFFYASFPLITQNEILWEVTPHLLGLMLFCTSEAIFSALIHLISHSWTHKAWHFSTKIWQYNHLSLLLSSQWALTLSGMTVNEELNSSLASKASIKRPLSLKDLIGKLESIKKKSSLHFPV